MAMQQQQRGAAAAYDAIDGDAIADIEATAFKARKHWDQVRWEASQEVYATA
jgi:hypothetical protein